MVDGHVSGCDDARDNDVCGDFDVNFGMSSSGGNK